MRVHKCSQYWTLSFHTLWCSPLGCKRSSVWWTSFNTMLEYFLTNSSNIWRSSWNKNNMTFSQFFFFFLVVHKMAGWIIHDTWHFTKLIKCLWLLLLLAQVEMEMMRLLFHKESFHDDDDVMFSPCFFSFGAASVYVIHIMYVC